MIGGIRLVGVKFEFEVEGLVGKVIGVIVGRVVGVLVLETAVDVVGDGERKEHGVKISLSVV